MTGPSHPAKFSPDILTAIGRHARGRVLDPFAGTGRVHVLIERDVVSETVGVEIEPEWAAMHAGTIVGNALGLPFPDSTFDTVATSPCYGNRLADHHDARDGSRRHSYTHDLGRRLHPDNAGSLHFGPEYQRFHEAAWAECRRVLRPGGVMIVNACDFLRNGDLVSVTSFHRLALVRLGFALTGEMFVPKVGLLHGANRERVSHEVVLIASATPLRRRRPRQPAPRRRVVVPQLPGQLSIYDALEVP